MEKTADATHSDSIDRLQTYCFRESAPDKRGYRPCGFHMILTFPITRAGSNGRRNTIWYKAVFKGGVYETRETVWPFSGAEDRCVASLEGGTDVA